MDLLASQKSLVYFELLIERSVALKTGEVVGSIKNDLKIRWTISVWR